MRNITRLSLAFAVAATACLSPKAHAEDEAQLVGSGIPSVRYYVYGDEDGRGAMLVQDGPAHPNGKWISVTIYQNGYAYSGQGWRSLASEETNWSAKCEFWVYGSGLSAKFTGVIPIKPGYGGGENYLKGSGAPYPWECGLN